jgi:hypothetical protein
MAIENSRPKEAAHDESPSIIDDHPFEPKGEWWTLCKHCNLAESAHKETTQHSFSYYSDDEDEYSVPIASSEGDGT